jgi:hypothetical protein
MRVIGGMEEGLVSAVLTLCTRHAGRRWNFCPEQSVTLSTARKLRTLNDQRARGASWNLRKTFLDALALF